MVPKKETWKLTGSAVPERVDVTEVAPTTLSGLAVTVGSGGKVE